MLVTGRRATIGLHFLVAQLWPTELEVGDEEDSDEEDQAQDHRETVAEYAFRREILVIWSVAVHKQHNNNTTCCARPYISFIFNVILHTAHLAYTTQHCNWQQEVQLLQRPRYCFYL